MPLDLICPEDRASGRITGRCIQTPLATYRHAVTGRPIAVATILPFAEPRYYRQLRRALKRRAARGYHVLTGFPGPARAASTCQLSEQQRALLKHVDDQRQHLRRALAPLGWIDHYRGLGNHLSQPIPGLAHRDILSASPHVLLDPPAESGSALSIVEQAVTGLADYARELAAPPEVITDPAQAWTRHAQVTAAVQHLTGGDAPTVLVWGPAQTACLHHGLAEHGFTLRGEPVWYTAVTLAGNGSAAVTR